MYRPSDYYSSASPQRVLPAWVSFGCGAASLLILIVVFAGGAFLAGGGLAQVMDWTFGATMGELRGMYTPEVSAAQKQSLDTEIETMRRNLREEKISVQSVNPVLQAIRRATADQKVDAKELESLLAATKKVNVGAGKKAKKVARLPGPLTRRFAPPSPRKRGEGQPALLRVALLPAGGEKVPEGRMRGTTSPWPPVATFSILGYDPKTGEVGGAVQSRVFSVGNGVLWAEAGTGVVATQAVIDVSYGPQGLNLLRAGLTPVAAVKAIWDSDPDPRPEDWTKQGRQFAIMDAKGNYAAYTGPKAKSWAGNKGGAYCTAQGNILAGEQVVASMVEAFEKTEGHLSLRLMAALDAGQKAGGDTRGMQSAAMLIVKKDGGVWLHNDVVLRLQVDDNPEPLTELRRLVDLAAKQRERIAAAAREKK